ncbi:hypothetical protein HU200_011876 [Digitaria exilis]|uniref:Uncharacterized protein n=1 Tax=Digitaria exilis TaxID=1010633 RepID=A0A835FFZ3_9POAL|nr:hypothetical protein HU200_058154 [Digitaria exilis]KAF8661226.1 hypothetical protein HU200_057070 [Digitaria exilis]KAF8690610.1 hypothetical protein HU200_040980 [Digitaria exilis]KAF8752738.1 hypothetical protein HU200_011876 [Digitaria exilis]
MTTSLDTEVLLGVRERIAEFIMNQVIPVKGEFHCNYPGIAI